MSVQTTGALKLKCSQCSEEHVYGDDEPEFEVVEGYERGMGREILHDAKWEFDCECGQTIEVNLRVSEYPAGTAEDQEQSVVGGVIGQAYDLGIEDDDPGDHEEDDPGTDQEELEYSENV
ncbi:MAG: hypothetical protein JNM63_14285 [Spirochaetia bacterium]|nr:hypothetical protein [Spirochaetia bacterium]